MNQMANLADAIKKSFLSNLGEQGIKRAYSNAASGADDDEERKRKVRLAALKKHIDSYTVR